jgi:hypothetical protein
MSTKAICPCSEVKWLRAQAEAVITAAKARVERMILGEEVSEDG